MVTVVAGFRRCYGKKEEEVPYYGVGKESLWRR